MWRRRAFQRAAAWAVLAAMLWALWVPSVWAQQEFPVPIGGEVVFGEGYIAFDHIYQQDDFIVIQWPTFSIWAGETVTFHQPDSYAIVLNEVTGDSQSQIDGNIVANGRVFLINPSGIVFGANATLDVGSFLGSTLKLTYSDYDDLRDKIYDFVNLRAPLQFVRPATEEASLIWNHGTLNLGPQDEGILPGYIVLISDNVYNHGAIKANGGSAVLAAGNRFYLGINPDGTVWLAPDENADGRGVLGTINTSVIEADGGAVILSATGPGSILNLGGTVRATTLEEREGRVFLSVGEGPARLGYDSGTQYDFPVITNDPVNSARYLHLETDRLEVTSGGDIVVEGYQDAQGNDRATSIEAATAAFSAAGDVTIEKNASLDAGAVTIASFGSVRLDENASLIAQDAAVEAGSDVSFAGPVVLAADRLSIEAGGDVLIDVEHTQLLGYNVDVRELAVEAGGRVEISDRTQLEIGGGALTSPLWIKAAEFVQRGQFFRPVGESFTGTAVVDAPVITLEKGLFFPSVTLTNTSGGPSTIDIGPDAVLAAIDKIDVIAKSGGTFASRGRIAAPYVNLHLGGGFDSVQIAELINTGDPSEDNTPRLRLYGGDGPGTWLEADSLVVHAPGDLRLAGQVKAGDVLVTVGQDVGWGARRSLTLEAGPAGAWTQIDASGRVTLAAGLAFKNQTTYGVDLFPGSARVTIYSGTDRFGYDPGSLDKIDSAGNVRFVEQYGVAYDPNAELEPDQDTIYIGEPSPSPVILIEAPDIEKVYDNTPVVLDPEGYVDDPTVSGLLFRLDRPEGGSGIDAGTYVIVPYGAESEVYRIVYLTGELEVLPRPLCPDGCAGLIEKVFLDPNPDFAAVLAHLFDLAPGDTVGSSGIRVHLPQVWSEWVGEQPLFASPDPSNPKSRNYAFPEEPVGTLRIVPRTVYIEIPDVTAKLGEVPPPDRLWGSVRFHNLDEAIDPELTFSHYINFVYVPVVEDVGKYVIIWLVADSPFMDNFNFERATWETGYLTVEPNLDYYTAESWKKLPLSESEYQCANAPDSRSDCDVMELPYGTTPPVVGNFSANAWPVVGRAISQYMELTGDLSERAFLEKLRLIQSNTDEGYEALGQLVPFLVAELASILDRDERTWTPAERAFVEEFITFVNKQRIEAANAAYREYQEWKAEDFRRRTGVGQGAPHLGLLFYYGSKPPDHFLQQAQSGLYVPRSQAENFEKVIGGAAGLGASLATAGVVGGVASTGALNSVVTALIPFLQRAGEAAIGTAIGAAAGPAAIVVMAIATTVLVAVDIADIIEYEEEMQQALENAYRPVTTGVLKFLIQIAPELVASWMVARTVRSDSHINTDPWHGMRPPGDVQPLPDDFWETMTGVQVEGDVELRGISIQIDHIP